LSDIEEMRVKYISSNISSTKVEQMPLFAVLTVVMKTNRTNLGEFEELVLLVVGVLNDNAYGISIMDEIEKQTGRALSISAVHSVLTRLETKGYLNSQMGGETKERGGRRKRFFKLTGTGKDAINEVREMRNKLWNIMPNLSLESVR